MENGKTVFYEMLRLNIVSEKSFFVLNTNLKYTNLIMLNF